MSLVCLTTIIAVDRVWQTREDRPRGQHGTEALVDLGRGVRLLKKNCRLVQAT